MGHKKNKLCVAICPAGLGNRIKCLISTIKYYDEMGSRDISIINKCSFTPNVYWPINDACGCKFEDLFEQSVILKEVCRGELYGIEVDAKYNDAYINKSWKFIDSNNEPLDFKYHKLSQAKINEFLPYFWHLTPKKDIADVAQSFFNKYKDSFNKSEVIGVHIRKGDFKVAYDGRAEVSKETDFVEKMRCLLEINPNYKFLLCTEDEETEERFRLRFGSNHIIYFPKRFRDRSATESVKESFVDILLLSKCPIIIGTFLSTFTEVAWWMGRCKARVVIPGIENKEAVDKVLSKLPQEGEGIYKKIIRKIKIIGEGLGIYGKR